MRLSNFVPSIPADVVSCLEALGVRTDTDLLFTTTPIDLFKRLPAGTATLEDLQNYIDIAAEMGAAPSMSGHELLLLEKKAQDKDRRLQTGSGELDEFFHGLNGRWLIELSGDKCSGKSTVALNLVLHHLALNLDDTVVWIDTTCDFSPDRASQILDAKQISSSTLERLQVALAFDIDTVQDLLDDIEQRNDPNLSFLVIDTITPLLGPLLSAVSAQGHAIMIDFMRHLQNFAQASGTAVLVINSSSRKGPDTQERKPALGPSFALMTDTTLWFQAEVDSNSEDPVLHTIKILRSRSAPTTRFCTFRIRGNVIHSA